MKRGPIEKKPITDQLPFGHYDNSFQSAGGQAGIRKLVEDFYNIMDTLEEARVIRAMHPKDLTVTIDKLALFLEGWLGGPRRFQEKYGPISIPAFHSHIIVTESERDAWLTCMQASLEKQPFSQDFKKYLLEQLFFPAERIRMTAKKPRM